MHAIVIIISCVLPVDSSELYSNLPAYAWPRMDILTFSYVSDTVLST